MDNLSEAIVKTEGSIRINFLLSSRKALESLYLFYVTRLTLESGDLS